MIDGLAAAALALGLRSLVRLHSRQRWPVFAVGVVAAGLFFVRPKVPLVEGASQPHVYFQPVTSTRPEEGEPLYALLHTTARDASLVIGVGTGERSRAVREAGFGHVDVVPSFEDDGFAESRDRPAARPFLRLTSTRYDLVSITPSRIWLAGSTSLYSRDFYRLAKTRLRPRGVLEQRVELHHLGVDDIVSVLGTLRSEFARVWLYVAGSQGVVVACEQDCAPTSVTLAAALGNRSLLADRLLSPAAVDEFLGQVVARGLALDALVSTDDNLFLELDAPRGNVRDFESSLRNNVNLLRSFAPPSLLDGTRLSEQDLEPEPSKEESAPVERPGLTRDARHGKTQP
jgi:hypothetical protein